MEKEYLEQLIEKAEKKRNKRKVFLDYLTLKRVKITVITVVVLGVVGAYHILGYDIDIDCTKSNNTCVLSKSSLVDPVPYKIARFDTGGILDVFVKSRTIKHGGTIYDILLDYGETRGQIFIDYGFNTVIKANTVKMKLTNYLSSHAPDLHISKHCFFNDYFCF